MEQEYWLSRMNAAVDAALASTTAESCLEHFYQAGLCSVRAASCGDDRPGDERGEH